MSMRGAGSIYMYTSARNSFGLPKPFLAEMYIEQAHQLTTEASTALVTWPWMTLVLADFAFEQPARLSIFKVFPCLTTCLNEMLILQVDKSNILRMAVT